MSLGVYVLQPWNMFLSPLIDEQLAVDRDFTFQSMGK